jgi:hypothetical protein
MVLSPKLENIDKTIREEDLILKGGSSGNQNEPVTNKQAVKRVQLRIPNDYLNRIGNLLDERAGNISRHTWIIEAIVEKLGKEEKEDKVSATSQ